MNSEHVGPWTKAWITLRGIVAETFLMWAMRAADPRDPAYPHLLVMLNAYLKVAAKVTK